MADCITKLLRPATTFAAWSTATRFVVQRNVAVMITLGSAARRNPFRVDNTCEQTSQGSRDGNLGLEDVTALRLYRDFSAIFLQWQVSRIAIDICSMSDLLSSGFAASAN